MTDLRIQPSQADLLTIDQTTTMINALTGYRETIIRVQNMRLALVDAERQQAREEDYLRELGIGVPVVADPVAALPAPAPSESSPITPTEVEVVAEDIALPEPEAVVGDSQEQEEEAAGDSGSAAGETTAPVPEVLAPVAASEAAQQTCPGFEKPNCGNPVYSKGFCNACYQRKRYKDRQAVGPIIMTDVKPDHVIGIEAKEESPLPTVAESARLIEREAETVALPEATLAPTPATVEETEYTSPDECPPVSPSTLIYSPRRKKLLEARKVAQDDPACIESGAYTLYWHFGPAYGREGLPNCWTIQHVPVADNAQVNAIEVTRRKGMDWVVGDFFSKPVGRAKLPTPTKDHEIGDKAS